MGKQWKQWENLFSWAPESLWMVTVAMTLKDAPWKKSNDKPGQHIKKQRHHFAYKGPSSQSYGFSRSHVWMESQTVKKAESTEELMLLNCGVREDSWESPLDCKEMQSVNPKINKSWIFDRGNDAEAEAPILWPPAAKNWLIGKDPNAGEDWKQEEKGTTEDVMAEWHCWLYGHELE